MFTRAARRLALLNAAVVVGIIAVTGASIYLLLQQGLGREEERSLNSRVNAARIAWTDDIAASQPIADVAELPAESIGAIDGAPGIVDGRVAAAGDGGSPLLTGDTFLFAFDRNARLLIDERGLTFDRIPDLAGVDMALKGISNAQTVSIGGANVRIVTEPVRVGDTVVGAVQGVRGLSQHESQRQLVLVVTILGITLGALAAVPAGLFLSRRAMQPIESAFARQQAFVSDASHELRTPLTVIRSQGEFIQRLAANERPDIRLEAEVVVAETEDMARLVSDLLLLARLDEQPGLISETTIDLADAIASAAEPLAGSVEAAGLNVSVDVQTPLIVNGDFDQLRRVVRILLDNAIRYSPPGGSLSILARRRGAEVHVRVRDTGIGIAAEDQERIFDRFYRSDRARGRSTGGAGLGLSIARAIIWAHGGQIGVESAPGNGSTFWFSIPVDRG